MHSGVDDREGSTRIARLRPDEKHTAKSGANAAKNRCARDDGANSRVLDTEGDERRHVELHSANRHNKRHWRPLIRVRPTEAFDDLAVAVREPL